MSFVMTMAAVAAAASGSKNQKKLTPQEKKKAQRNIKFLAGFMILLGVSTTISGFNGEFDGYLIAGPLAVVLGLGLYYFAVKKI